PIHQDTQFFDGVYIFLNFSNTLRQHFVVSTWRRRQELHTTSFQFAHGVYDVLGFQSHVLYAFAFIEFQVLLDLRFFLTLSWLVDGEFYVAVTVTHYLT